MGNKNVTLGIPRLKELLDQAKTIRTPTNRVHLLPPYAHSAAFASFFAATLPLTRLGDIVSRCDLVHDPDPRRTVTPSDADMVELDARVGDPPAQEYTSQYVVRLLLNQSVMQTRRITPPMVRSLLRDRLHNKAHVISSETNAVDWVIRIRFERMAEMLHALPEGARREYEGLLCHRVIAAMLNTIAVSGHIGISGAQVATETHDDKKGHMVDTQGTSLINLSAAACVDWYRTTSNDINEIHATLGIEATVATLFHELVTTISFDGTYVDPRHIMMIVNTMTRGGYVMPLSRHGLNRMHTGPLLRCSFEETPDILCDAACFGERDNGLGVSQNIMTGKLAEIGSGAMHIRAGPSMMHARDALMHQRVGTKPRVVKSVVRHRQPEMLTEVHERERGRQKRSIESPAIDPPFAVPDGRQDDPPTQSIFSMDATCQVPYTEDAKTETSRAAYERPVKRQREYRPASPSSGDDPM